MSSNANFGEQRSTGTLGDDSGDAGLSFAMKYIAPGSGKLLTLSIWASTAAGNIIMGLYSDSAGSPNTLLDQTAVFTLVNGLNTHTVLNRATITNGTTYWIAWNCTSNSFVMPIFNDAGFTTKYRAITAGTLADPFGTPDATDANHWTGFATFGITDSLFLGCGTTG